MKLDFTEMQENANRANEEQNKQFYNGLNTMQERHDAETAAFMQGLNNAADKKETEIRAQMDREIKAAQEEAAAQIRARYAAKYGAKSWNMDAIGQGLASLAATFRQEGTK